MTDIVYHLNADDEVVLVNEAWSRFASANGGDVLLPPMVLHRRLWDFIADPSTQHIYSTLFTRVRSRGDTVRLTFRCDAPALRRLLELELAPLAGNGVLCRVHPLVEESRDPILLLDATRPRREQLIRICSWCKRIATPDGAWLQLEVAVTRYGIFVDELPPDLTHGVCPDCHRILDGLANDDEVGTTGQAVMGKL